MVVLDIVTHPEPCYAGKGEAINQSLPDPPLILVYYYITWYLLGVVCVITVDPNEAAVDWKN